MLNVALHLQEEKGGDRLTIAAALTHDVHRLIQNEAGTFCSPADSLPRVEAILAETGLSEERRARVLHCVEHHEEYGFSEGGRIAENLETLLLQDADNLDAMGAVGIGRTFAFGGARGLPRWDPAEPLEAEGSGYDPAGGDLSVLHHFYSKLPKLKGNMHTPTARAMAEERHRFMQAFAEVFQREWEGAR